MSKWLESLRALQGIDAKLYGLRSDERALPRALEHAKQMVAEQQANAQAVEARLKTLQVKQKEKELDLSTREEQVKKLQLQLFQVKTNKEYGAIQQMIEQAKADASLLEEDILTLLDTVEHAKQEHAAARQRVATQQDALRAEESRITRELEAIREQIGALERERQALLPSVDPATLSTYERVLVNRDGLALVPLINSSCGGCHMVQPPQVISETYLKAKVVLCGHCSRILYVDESAPAL